jgi:mono/diheme cytochrome c family protein
MLFLVPAALLSACQPEDQSSQLATVSGRWYTPQQVDAGAGIFSRHCASCHGDKAQGLHPNWKQRLPDGSLPPPPLNGSAHAWHHPLSVLDEVISAGGVPLGGTMPAFAALLNERERRAAVAYFQSFWSEEIYENWQQMGGAQ